MDSLYYKTDDGVYHSISEIETVEVPKPEEYTNEGKTKTVRSPMIYGWICPVCGRGLSPYINTCPCKGDIVFKPKITC